MTMLCIHQAKQLINRIFWRITTNKITDVPTHAIQRSTRQKNLDQYRNIDEIRGVVGGDWDLQSISIHDSTKIVSILNHFEEGIPWKDTKYHTELGAPVHDLEKYDLLYRDMKKNGFDRAKPIDLFVGREGEIIINHGRHRYAIAKSLNLCYIPSRIKAIHLDYVENHTYNAEGYQE